MNKINRIKELVEKLNYHRDLYYNTSKTEMSDFEYDNLFDELSQLEKETGFVLATSPVQTVGYEVKSSLNKVTHNHPMLSLDKTKSVDDIIRFLDNRDGVVMAKMDGLTCSLRYLNGELVSAETRGNGEIGEDILHCAKTITNLPLKIDCLDEVIIDGEVIITYDDFDKINKTLPEEQRYKHPRNLASGSIRQLDSSVAAQRNMNFVAWKLVKGWVVPNSIGGLIDENSFFDRLWLLCNLGFDVTPCAKLHRNSSKECINNFIEQIKTICKIKGYPIDGCVFGYDDVEYGESLGATGHHLRSQIAFKFYDELYETKLLNIDWTIGKTGVLTPTAVFESVEIDGTEVSRASLHNISIIKSLGLTNNCTVKVYKANQIIPQIDSCEQDGNGEIIIPSVCPICGHSTTIKKDNESEVLMCTNPDCSAKKIAQFVHFVSRKAMDIDGLSEKTLEALISHGFVRDFKDIYHLTDYENELICLDGFGKKSVEKLLKSIEESRNVNLANFICALGIPTIGSSASKTIAEYCNYDIGRFLRLLWESRWNTGFSWTELNDFGEVAAKNLDEYFDKNVKMLREFADEMNFIVPEKKTNNSLDGLRFCITGSFTQPRDSLKKRLEDHGAKFISSVSKNLDVLFAGDKAGSKLTKAQALGIKIANEEELMKLLED